MVYIKSGENAPELSERNRPRAETRKAAAEKTGQNRRAAVRRLKERLPTYRK